MEVEISRNYNISRLKQWLDYELSTSTLILLSWFWNFTIILAAITAVLFTPFMLKILFEERKFGWIITFLIVIILPAVIIFFIDNTNNYQYILGGVVLVFFYFYCFVLRFVIKDWMQ